KAAEHLQDAEAIEAQPAAGEFCGFWRFWLLRGAVGLGLRSSWGWGWRHGIQEGGDGGGSPWAALRRSMPPPVTPASATPARSSPPRRHLLLQGRLRALIGESLHLVPALLAGIAVGSGRQRLTAVVKLQGVEQGGGIGPPGWRRTAKAQQAAAHGCG
ncbi:MAG: hypothetical protein RLZZ117_324, partial [Cyanobacteriota bacterium]